MGAQTLRVVQWATSTNGWGPHEEAEGVHRGGWCEWVAEHANGHEWTGKGGGCSEQVECNST